MLSHRDHTEKSHSVLFSDAFNFPNATFKRKKKNTSKCWLELIVSCLTLLYFVFVNHFYLTR